MPKTSEILGVILGGGQGKRLFPLTSERSNPAVPIAGKYRLIDIPSSNCINSDICRIAVLTQSTPVSLHRHISQTYLFDAFHRVVQSKYGTNHGTYRLDQGTADAVRKQPMEITSTKCPYVLILAGDHLSDGCEMAVPWG